MPQSIKPGWLGWASWASADPTPKTSCRAMKKAPQGGWHAKEHLTLALPAASRHWKIQLLACSFHWETQSSTLLRLKQITKENFIYFYWTVTAEQKTLHWCLPPHLVFHPYGIFKAGVGLDPKQNNMFPQGWGCYRSHPYSYHQLQLPSVPQKNRFSLHSANSD